MNDVILLHGLAGSKFTMWRIGRTLRKAGFEPYNLSYPSTRFELEELAGRVRMKLENAFGPSPAGLNFVTYSMGGILLRQLAHEHPYLVHRAVMLAPPNRGSPWGGLCRTSLLLRPWVGPAARQLGVGPDSKPNRLGPVDFPLGVIAGTRPDNPLAARLFDAPNDGRVSVEQACIEGMTSLRTFPYGHFELPFRRPVIQSVIEFLQHEAFSD